MEDSEVEQCDRARSGSDLFPGVLGGSRSILRRKGAGRIARWPDENLDRFQSSRKRDRLRLPRGCAWCSVTSRGDQRSQDRQLSSLPANSLERESKGYLWNAGALRRCGAKYAHLRRERARQVQGDRYHACRAQFRPLPALRRAHVPRQWKSAGDASFADVWPGAVELLQGASGKLRIASGLSNEYLVSSD